MSAFGCDGGLRLRKDVTRREAAARPVAQLAEVGIPDGERRLAQYPHQPSGGLLQRVMIAAALLAEPRLILADEPTTALDVTTQEEVLAILDEQRRERGLALILITHDLDLAAAVTDSLAVLYAGSIAETGPAATLYERPLHPYTAALLAAHPGTSRRGRLAAIPGRRAPLTRSRRDACWPRGVRTRSSSVANRRPTCSRWAVTRPPAIARRNCAGP
ncbi:ATP-binding cassette domain-containing protein [Streptomyces sp. CA-142005]|uniref:ATP-binding cassette domain-containing protein n=1 Tax=Streptomyces sp. CA-142005 TaxID=3240052 RepID=UPI003D89C902